MKSAAAPAAPGADPTTRRGALTAWERRGFNVLHSAIFLTGVGYFWMKYVVTTDDPFALVNHPWQPATLAAHIVVAPFGVAFFGILFRSHAYRKLVSPNEHQRKSGWLTLLSFGAMALSGYLIQVASSPAWVEAFIWTHVGTGSLFVGGYGAHAVHAWKDARLIAGEPCEVVARPRTARRSRPALPPG